jgi:peptidoglycan/LPS O-acetylase OafA/YrhL
MRTLASLIDVRNNNFHLIRMVAASMVLVSHSVAIATGKVELEPWRAWLGLTPGSVAVDIFFVVSGLLVSQSLDRRKDAKSFVLARFFRIWPGLLVALLLTVFGLALWFNTMSVAEFLSDKVTWHHVTKNIVLIFGVHYHLPGAFDTNPLPHIINGSLWTLPAEIRSYGGLLALWLAATWGLKDKVAFRWIVLLPLLYFGGRHFVDLGSVSVEKSGTRIFAMFFAGSAAYWWREKLVIPMWAGPVLGGLLALSLLHPPTFAWAYSLILAPLVISLAYQPSGFLLNYNRLGDYSYGTYVYAYPIQQAVAAQYPGCSSGFLMLVSGAGTLVMAVFSWYWVERPAMRWAAQRWKKKT